MADTNLVLDEAIRSAFRVAARPGDPTGVAEAIRSRLDNPDGGPGGGPDGSGGPAGGSGPTGMPFPLAWFAGAAVLALAGGAALGWSGALGRPPAAALPDAPAAVASSVRTVDTYDCPGAAVVGSLTAGDRVLALGTHDGWAAVRDPRDTAQVVWVDADVLTVDPGQVQLASLPLEGCPQLLADAAEPPPPDDGVVPDPDPGPNPGPAPAPGPKPAPGPAPVDNPPTVGQGSAAPATIFAQGCAPDTAQVSVVAGDDKGVSSVTMSWSGGSAGMSQSGPTWSGTFGPIASVPVQGQNFVVTVVATDTAGQTASTTVTVFVEYCLI